MLYALKLSSRFPCLSLQAPARCRASLRRRASVEAELPRRRTLRREDLPILAVFNVGVTACPHQGMSVEFCSSSKPLLSFLLRWMNERFLGFDFDFLWTFQIC